MSYFCSVYTVCILTDNHCIIVSAITLHAPYTYYSRRLGKNISFEKKINASFFLI